ncbi:MAG: type II toxin-antitoxin system Phd/YefM family antitoxin [Acidobacteria bacterium]|nr:type II toxin-antitoxin system Phd/YefM family antitoxin [Acidobacteriota bacterium]
MNKGPERMSASMAKYQFSQIVDRVRDSGEVIIIQRHNMDAAALVPLKQIKNLKKKPA